LEHEQAALDEPLEDLAPHDGLDLGRDLAPRAVPVVGECLARPLLELGARNVQAADRGDRRTRRGRRSARRAGRGRGPRRGPGGGGPPPYETVNLGRSTGDRPEAVTENRRRMLVALGLSPERLATAGQVHGAAVARADSPGHYEACDALVTRTPGLALAISAA